MKIAAIWKKIKHNLGLKVLSVVVAFLIWIGVINFQDPVETVTFHNVPVTIKNENTLTEKDKIPEIIEGSTIMVEVEARRSICEKLTSNNIVATADFEKISITDAVPIDVEVKGYSENEVEIIRGYNNVLKLRLEDYDSKEFKVKIQTVGNPADGYVIKSSVASPNVITVSGSKTQISRIKEVYVELNVDEITGDITANLKPVALDANDEIITNANLELSTSVVSVKSTVYRTKDIIVSANLIGKVAEGYEVTGVACQPQSVTVAGTSEDLKETKYNTVFDIDIEGASDNIEKNIAVTDLFDKDLSSLFIVSPDDGVLAVTVYVSKIREKTVPIAVEDIQIINAPKGFLPAIRTISSDLISVYAEAITLGKYDIADFKPTVDLSTCTSAGVYTLPVKFENPEGCTVSTTTLNATLILVPIAEDEDGE